MKSSFTNTLLNRLYKDSLQKHLKYFSITKNNTYYENFLLKGRTDPFYKNINGHLKLTINKNGEFLPKNWILVSRLELTNYSLGSVKEHLTVKNIDSLIKSDASVDTVNFKQNLYINDKEVFEQNLPNILKSSPQDQLEQYNRWTLKDRYERYFHLN